MADDENGRKRGRFDGVEASTVDREVKRLRMKLDENALRYEQDKTESRVALEQAVCERERLERNNSYLKSEEEACRSQLQSTKAAALKDKAALESKLRESSNEVESLKSDVLAARSAQRSSDSSSAHSSDINRMEKDLAVTELEGVKAEVERLREELRLRDALEGTTHPSAPFQNACRP